MKKLLLLCALLLVPLSGHAQNVRQTGIITPGHAAAWSANGVIRDAGTIIATTCTNQVVTALATNGTAARNSITNGYLTAGREKL